MRGTDVCPLCLVTLVARALLRCVFRDGCVLRNILSSLSSNGLGCVPALFVVYSEVS